jgi:hypothetical protein
LLRIFDGSAARSRHHHAPARDSVAKATSKPSKEKVTRLVRESDVLGRFKLITPEIGLSPERQPGYEWVAISLSEE